jgi:hypothetical protein
VRTAPLRLALAAIAALFAIPASAEAGGEQIGCIEANAPAADVLAVGSDEGARERVNRQAQACARLHGWTADQARAAYEYTVGKAIYEDGLRVLARRGIRAVIVDQVGADLGETRLAALAAGQAIDLTEEEVGRIVVRRLRALGFRRFRDGSPQWEQVGVDVGRAMAGKYFRDRALAAFQRP